MILCCIYCFTMSVALGCYAWVHWRFTGFRAPQPCYYLGENATTQAQDVIMFGFWVHFIGFFCDLSMLLRIKTIKHEGFGKAALVAVIIYTLAFVVWLVWLMVVAFGKAANNCDMPSMPDNTPFKQVTVLKNFVIGTLCANVGIGILVGVYKQTALKA